MSCLYKYVCGEKDEDLREVTTGPGSTISVNLSASYNALKAKILYNTIDERLMTPELLNYVDPELQKPILLLACKGSGDFATVTADTITSLIENGATLDYVDQKWYGWEALHYAASASDHAKLEVVCTKLGRDKVNTLTLLSENALHVLLDRGRLSQSLNLACQNGMDSKMSKIINQEQDCVVQCADVLIKAGVDVNHSNFWNETPILLAIKRKYYEVVKLLLKTENIDLDSCKGAVSGKTARELLKGKEAIVGVLPKHSAVNEPSKVLFQLLKAGDEEGFLKCHGDKITGFVNDMDGDNASNSSCTMLQYCFRRGMIAWHQVKKQDYGMYRQYQDITANRLVQVFCQDGMAKCILHLLDNGANVNVTLRKFENGRPLLEVAIIKGYYPLVALILGPKQCNLSLQEIEFICKAMIELVKNGTNDIDMENGTNNIYINNTLSVVLTHLLTVEQPEKIGEKLKELLKEGVKIINKDNMLLLLKFPGSLWKSSWKIKQKSFWCCKTSTTEKVVLEEIDPEVLQTHFNDCVEQNDGKIYINYNSFIGKKEVNIPKRKGNLEKNNTNTAEQGFELQPLNRSVEAPDVPVSDQEEGRELEVNQNADNDNNEESSETKDGKIYINYKSFMGNKRVNIPKRNRNPERHNTDTTEQGSELQPLNENAEEADGNSIPVSKQEGRDPEVNQNVDHDNNEESSEAKDSVHQVLEVFLCSSGLNKFLNHLVFKILIMRKWHQLHLKLPCCKFTWKYFYVNLFFYIIFYFLLNGYVLFKFNGVADGFVTSIHIIGCCFLALFISKEIFQIVANPYLYVREFNNYPELIFILLTVVVYGFNDQWVDSVAVLSVLSSNIVLLLLLEQVPKFSKYMIILKTIVFYLQYIGFYFIQFIAFAICFYILFANSDQDFFKDFFNKLFETIILFTGSVDYMKTPWKKDENETVTEFHTFGGKEIFSKIIFILFVLFMAIILHNLLLGLLVTDMTNLNKDVKLFEQIKRASFVVRLEKFFEHSCTKCLSGILTYEAKDDERQIMVTDHDRKILDDDEKQHLDFILARKDKKQEPLKKLYGYIRRKLKERCFEEDRHEVNEEVLGKLEFLEEGMKNLDEMIKILRADLKKNQ